MSSSKPKPSKVIMFSKDGEIENDQIIQTGKAEFPPIELSKIIDRDIPYGKSTHTESKECADKKKNHMLQDNYFSSTVNKDNLIDMSKLPEYFIISEEEVNKQSTSLFSSGILDTNKVATIKNNLSSYQNESNKGVIGPLILCESLNTLINVGAKGIAQLFQELKKDISMARFIYNDGNSFYRAFMLGILEHHILYFDLYSLRKLAIGILTTKAQKLNKYEPIINYNEVIIIFHLIISLVIEKKSKEAYDLLISAINQSKSLDYALIKYMRIALAEYIETNEASIFKTENWEEIEAIAAPAYLSNHSFDYKNYIRDRVLVMNYEADKFLVQISPVVFHINLDLYCIEGTANEVKHISYLNQYFHCITNQSFHHCISIFYSFARYHRVYHKNHIQYHNTNITSKLPTAVIDAPIRFKVITKNANCIICKETSDLICFNHIQRAELCKNCLINAIDHIITKRITHFIEEYYNNKEFYFRPIALSDNEEERLEDEDFIDLFNRNIAQQILYTMDQLCFQCMKLLGNNYQTMPCQCKLCNICTIDNIMNSTNQKVILNQYEKTHSTFKLVKCPCGNIFDTDAATNLVYKSKIEQLTNEANLRLIKTAEILCSYCGKFHKKANYSKTISMNTNTRKSEYLEVIKFSVLNENDSGSINCVHIMCKNCLKEAKLDKLNKIKRGELKEDTSFYPLNCKVCIKTHQIEEKTLSDSKNNGCCFLY